jgi:heme o synthase
LSIRARARPARRPGRLRASLLGYLALTKPRVIELLLVTAIPAMLLAHRGTVAPLLIANTLIGGMLAAAGANTLNCVADADIDKVMKRTARRPLPREAPNTWSYATRSACYRHHGRPVSVRSGSRPREVRSPAPRSAWRLS